jgi:hypothetical protein
VTIDSHPDERTGRCTGRGTRLYLSRGSHWHHYIPEIFAHPFRYDDRGDLPPRF